MVSIIIKTINQQDNYNEIIIFKNNRQKIMIKNHLINDYDL